MPCPFRLFRHLSLFISLWAIWPGELSASSWTWTQIQDTRGRFILDIDIFLHDPDSVFALSFDALFVSGDEGLQWDSIAPGACCGVLAASTTNSTHLFMNQTGVPFPGNALWRSTDQGTSWSEIAHGMCAGYETCAAHIFKASPGSGNPLYTSLNPYVLLRTDDNGVTWDSIMIPPNYGFWSLEISHQDPEVMYISYATPVRAYRSDNGGLSWQELPFPYTGEDTAVFLALDPGNHDVLYAAVRGYGVMKSYNGGLQWSLMNDGLQEENLSFNVITVNPHNPDEIFLGVADTTASDGEGGLVFASVDAGESWVSLSEGLPPTGHVTALVIDPRTLRILAGINTPGEHPLDSGIYRLGPPTTVSGGLSLPTDSPLLFQNSPNPFNGETTIRFVVNSRTAVKITLHTVVGELVRILMQREMEAGEHKVLLNAAGLTTGVYFCTLEAAGQRTTRRMMLLR